MKRADFLKATLLAPLAGLFGFRSEPGITITEDFDISPVFGWRSDFARDVYTSPVGKEYTAEELERLQWDQRAYLRMLDS